MKRQDIIAIIEQSGPFANPIFTSNSPTFGKCSMFEPARQFILSALHGDIKPAFEYKNPDHIGYLYKGCHLDVVRVCAELKISDYIRVGTGIYEAIVSFKLQN